MAQNTDDWFASLGGSLMKDLWADLQVGENEDDGMGWSLEQLERELAHLEDTPLDEATTTIPAPAAPSSYQAPPGLSAASLVVSHAQERGVNTAGADAAPASVDDAWSQSLQKFTALSLEEDFLAADSARKQTPAVPSPDLAFLADATGAEDYDVAETVTLLGPPPGLSTGSAEAPAKKPPGMPSPLSKKSVVKMAAPQRAEPPVAVPDDVPRRLPPTPQNSFAEERRPPPTPQNSFADSPATSQNSVNAPPAAVATAPPILPKRMPPTPQNSLSSMPPGSPMVMSPQQTAAKGLAPKTTASQQQQQQQQQQQPVVVMARPPAWQQRTAPQAAPQAAPPPPRPSQPVFCQSHPAAPPIPATALESSLMKARDIAYVLHSMLRPIMAMGTSLSDYNVQLLARHQGQPPLRPMQKGKGDQQQANVMTPEQRTKEWMEKNATLGHVARTDVTRPRALIATSSATALSDKDDDDNKQRASLWKARMCIDQAYQAHGRIVEIWKAAAPGTVPPEVQSHMRRLYKYLGIKRTTNDEKDGSSDYVVDKGALQLLLKLPKGRTLLARILEQALLPPKAVQALLPVSLSVLLSSNASSDVTDDRLFRAWRQVLTTLPNIAPKVMLDGIQAFLEFPKKALGTTPRMECVHALLHRGNVMAGQLPEFVPAWREREQAFLKLLETSV